jgi:hypothetical protein
MCKKNLATTGRPYPTLPYSNSRRLRLRDITGTRKECKLAAIVHDLRKLAGLIGLSFMGVSTAVNVQNVRILHQNLAIDIAGLSWCIIPVQKYSVVYGQGIACDRRDQAAAAREFRVTTSIRAKLISRPPTGNRRYRRDGAAALPKLLGGDRSNLGD